jgi:hypothetical protein
MSSQWGQRLRDTAPAKSLCSSLGHARLQIGLCRSVDDACVFVSSLTVHLDQHRSADWNYRINALYILRFRTFWLLVVFIRIRFLIAYSRVGTGNIILKVRSRV